MDHITTSTKTTYHLIHWRCLPIFDQQPGFATKMSVFLLSLLVVCTCAFDWVKEAGHKLEDLKAYDRCQSSWAFLSWNCHCTTHNNYLTRLHEALSTELFGQSEAGALLERAIKSHNFKENKKPTVIHIAGVCVLLIFHS